MKAFAALVDSLVYTSSRNAKLALIAQYLRDTPDPDRGWALAALTDGLDFPAVKGSTIRNLLMERVDPVLFALSRDFVGDTAETASLLWPERRKALAHDVLPPPTVAQAVHALQHMTRATAPAELAALLDRLDANGRYALLKLATGAMRIGISAGAVARVMCWSAWTASETLGGGTTSPIGSGHSRLAVSAVSPTKSRLSANSTGSTRSISRLRMVDPLTAGKSSPSVSAASAQPRSGSGVPRRYCAISASLPLRLRV